MWILSLMVIVFILGYAVIVFEHRNEIDKAATAVLMGVILWTILSLFSDTILSLGYSRTWAKYLLQNPGATVEHMHDFVTRDALLHHLADISSILFFLLGAMTIVETVDHFQGFQLITSKVKTTSRVRLIWIIGLLTFFMSAILDNLTTTIIMIALLRKLVAKKEDRWYIAGIIVIAANAGGAWSPIGDVTTIMLWIDGEITSKGVITTLFIPSLISLLIPLLFSGLVMKGKVERPVIENGSDVIYVPFREQLTVLLIGVFGLISVPVFKTYTHLPPFMGMLLALAAIWIFTDRRLRKVEELDKRQFSVVRVLRKVDVSTILFFLGILLAVDALQTAGQLHLLSEWLTEKFHNVFAINTSIGIISSIVDNVPLVAASMNMYEITPAAHATGYLAHFVVDGHFWQLLAYCAGTGGSMLIIGSAAGVAAMGMEQINFFWYLKKIGWLAVIGYFAGIGAYAIFHVLL